MDVGWKTYRVGSDEGEIVSIDLIDFEPQERPPVVRGIPNLRHD